MRKSVWRKSPASFNEERLDIIRHALLFAGSYISYVKETNPTLHTEANGSSNLPDPRGCGYLDTENTIALATKYMEHECKVKKIS